MKQFGIAIIGFGNIGKEHVKFVRRYPDRAKLCGVYDFRSEVKTFIEKEGTYAYKNMDELLGATDVDIIIIATLNDTHAELSIKALKAGKNVICEKPAALNVADYLQVLDVAKETGKLFSVHQNRRWDLEFQTAQKIIDDGLIGNPYFGEIRVRNSRGGMYGWRGHSINGGMTFDWGAHIIDQILQIDATPLVSVDAHLQSVFTPETDDNIRLFFRFKSGFSALLEVTTNDLIEVPRWRLQGTKGTAVINLVKDSFGGNGEIDGKVVVIDEEKTKTWEETDLTYNKEQMKEVTAQRVEYVTKELPLPKLTPEYKYYDNIFDVLENKAELIIKPEQTLRVMKVIEAVFESHKKGHGVAVEI